MYIYILLILLTSKIIFGAVLNVVWLWWWCGILLSKFLSFLPFPFLFFALHLLLYIVFTLVVSIWYITSPHYACHHHRRINSKTAFLPVSLFSATLFFGTLALLLCCYGRGRMAHSNSRFYVNMYVYLYYMLYILQRVSRKALHIFSLLNSGKQKKATHNEIRRKRADEYCKE